MKKHLLPALLVLALGASACASPVYTVHMKNGDVYQSQDEPQFDKRSSTYHFRDTEGRIVQVTKDDVQDIKKVQ